MKFIFSCIFLSVSVLVWGQNDFGKDRHVQRVAFYNVENLFDTVDDPMTRDEEFLPTGKKAWTAERYDKKLQQLAQVFEEINYPNVIGLCEVENAEVVRDLAEKTSMKKEKYEVVHFDSPDFRGIDAALMYKKKCFEVLQKDLIRITFPEVIVKDYTTRDVLIVKGILHKKDTVHFFVNHWPSRRGGVQQSSPKREYVAAQVRLKIEEIYAENPAANIIIMGDFNDEPDNKSVAEVLIEGIPLYNVSAAADAAGQGTYNYRGNWNMIDQFIVSKNLRENTKGLRLIDSYILREEYLFYDDRKYGKTPTRTYGGSRYFGGYSDHLPIYMDLRR